MSGQHSVRNAAVFGLWRLLLLCVLLSGFIPDAPGSNLPGPIPLSRFAQAEPFMAADLSPDGHYVAVLSAGESGLQLVISDVSGGRVNDVKKYRLPVSQFDWMAWISSQGLLVSYTRVPERPSRVRQPVREFVVVDVGHDELRKVLSLAPGIPVSRYEGQLVDRLTGDEGHALISYSKTPGHKPGVYRLDLESSAVSQVQAPQDGIHEWRTDFSGIVRLGIGADGDGNMLFRFRASGSSPWTNLHESSVFKGGYFEPLAFNASGTGIYVLSSLGKGRKVLYQYDLARGRITRKLYENPRYDIAYVMNSYAHDRPAAVAYIDDLYELALLDESLREPQQHIARLLGNPHSLILGIDGDFNTFLVLSQNAPLPDRLYVYYGEGSRLVPLEYDGPLFDGYELAESERVSYLARDGLEIPAYVTYPVGAVRKALPAVILPHGGPWVRDFLRYDYLVQFLASRGYVVLQPNYRGSSGFGYWFEARGFGEWGLAMQDDLSDGVRWLIETGTVDPQRICILGASYGGYAALMAAAETPELFKCAVSIAPVTDLQGWLDWLEGLPAGVGTRVRVLGGRDSSYLHENSPVHRAAEMDLPLLLVHGDRDVRVPIEHSEALVKALGEQNKACDYVVLRGASHALDYAADRRRLLEEVEQFLAQHLGSAGPVLR